jgi:hypothetical protein
MHARTLCIARFLSLINGNVLKVLSMLGRFDLHHTFAKKFAILRETQRIYQIYLMRTMPWRVNVRGASGLETPECLHLT